MKLAAVQPSVYHLIVGVLVALASFLLFRTPATSTNSRPSPTNTYAMSDPLIVAPTAKHTASIIFSHVSLLRPRNPPGPQRMRAAAEHSDVDSLAWI